MKKILYITTLSRTINAFLVPHIEMLIKEGYEVDCACCIDKELDKELINLGVTVFNIPFSRNPFNLNNVKAYFELIKIQKKYNYNIIHVHTPVAALYGRLLKVFFRNLKSIYTVHGYHFYKGSPLLNWVLYYPLERIMSYLTDINITINKEDYERAKTFHCRNNYLINGVGLDLNNYRILDETSIKNKRKELNLDKDDFIIIMIAELNKNKNQKQLIDAMKLLKGKYPKIKALCVGEGVEQRKLENLIEKYELQSSVKLLGFRTDINELINISDVGILLSYREGLPRNIMEIMASGKSIIGTNIRGIKDLVTEDVGQLVECDDARLTADIIEKFYLGKMQLTKYSKSIVSQVDEFSIKNVNENLLDIYNKVGIL